MLIWSLSTTYLTYCFIWGSSSLAVCDITPPSLILPRNLSCLGFVAFRKINQAICQRSRVMVLTLSSQSKVKMLSVNSYGMMTDIWASVLKLSYYYHYFIVVALGVSIIWLWVYSCPCFFLGNSECIVCCFCLSGILHGTITISPSISFKGTVMASVWSVHCHYQLTFLEHLLCARYLTFLIMSTPFW